MNFVTANVAQINGSFNRRASRSTFRVYTMHKTYNLPTQVDVYELTGAETAETVDDIEIKVAKSYPSSAGMANLSPNEYF